MSWIDGESNSRNRGRRPPPRLSEAYLEAAAARYLRRFWAPTASLRRVLNKRVRAAVEAHGDDPVQGGVWVEELLTRLTHAGVLDDAHFAAERARQLHERGIPAISIRQRLRQKGLQSEHIDAALAKVAAASPDADLEAGRAYARRRRLGPFRQAADRPERRQRDLAAMARAGFSYDIARRVIEAPPPDEQE